MSGGSFDYKQYQVIMLADEIEQEIEHIEQYKNYSNNTLYEFKKGLNLLRKAYIYAQRIDYLISGDDDEESFHERLKKELSKLLK